jgi:ATP-binding cassette subfamily C protein
MSRAQSSGVAALLRDYRRFAGRRLWLSLALMIMGAAAEGFGLLMLVPLATVAIGGSESRVSRLVPFAASWTSQQRFLAALALFVAAMAARSLLLLARDTLLSRVEADYEVSLRLRSAATLARRGWPFASSIGQPAMQSLLLNDVPRAGQASGFIQQGAVAATMLMVQFVIAFILSPPLTLLALAFLVVGAAFSLKFVQRGVRRGLSMTYSMEDSASSGFRLHAGLKAALAQGSVPAFLAEYRRSLSRTAGQMVRFATDYSYAQQAISFAAALVAAVLLLVGVRVLALPFPVLVTSLVVFARMSGPAQQLQNSAVRTAAFASSFAAIEQRLGPLDWNVPKELPRKPVTWKELVLKQVRHQHGPGLGVAEASLRLQRGEWLGLRGASGAGKTTLIDLAAGLLTPQGGMVALDGQQLEGATLERWREALAYLGQEGSVFNDTIRGNLLAEGVDAGEADLWAAIETVGLADRVRAFPNGIDESVGDRGSHLSGGERQRLALARALLRKPSLLIFDEATAALDPESEAELIKRLKAIGPRPAALVVAHRASTLAHCDSVITIQHGVVSAAG